MADSVNPMGILATLLALGLAPTAGMMLGGGWVAAFAFVATAVIVTMRAFAKHNVAVRDRAPLVGELTPQQAMGMLSALHGQPLATSVLARVEALDELAKTDPSTAYTRVLELVAEAPRNVAALVLCARLAFTLDRSDAVHRWDDALRTALDTGLNRVAATTFVAHRDQREALSLGGAHRRALVRALEANGHTDDAVWWLRRGNDATDRR